MLRELFEVIADVSLWSTRCLWRLYGRSCFVVKSMHLPALSPWDLKTSPSAAVTSELMQTQYKYIYICITHSSSQENILRLTLYRVDGRTLLSNKLYKYTALGIDLKINIVALTHVRVSYSRQPQLAARTKQRRYNCACITKRKGYQVGMCLSTVCGNAMVHRAEP